MPKRCILGRVMGMGEVVLLGLWCERAVTTFLIAVSPQKPLSQDWAATSFYNDSWLSAYAAQQQFFNGLQSRHYVISRCGDSLEPITLQHTERRFLAQLRLGYTCRVTYDEYIGLAVTFTKDGEKEIIEEPMEALVFGDDFLKEQYLAQDRLLSDDNSWLSPEINTDEDWSERIYLETSLGKVPIGIKRSLVHSSPELVVAPEPVDMDINKFLGGSIHQPLVVPSG